MIETVGNLQSGHDFTENGVDPCRIGGRRDNWRDFADCPAAFAASPTKAAISEEARAAVAQMGKTLLADQFSFQARALRISQPSGQPLRWSPIKVLLRRPDRLMISVAGDDGSTKLLYDGRTATLGAETNKYVTVPVPNTIQGISSGDGQAWRRLSAGRLLANNPDKSFLSGVIIGPRDQHGDHRRRAVPTCCSPSGRGSISICWKRMTRPCRIAWSSPIAPSPASRALIASSPTGISRSNHPMPNSLSAAGRRDTGRTEAGQTATPAQGGGANHDRMILGCLSAVFAVSLATEAFSWARFAVRPAAGPIAVRWAARRCAVQPATRRSAVRPAALRLGQGGGGVSAAGGGSLLRRCSSSIIRVRRSRRVWPSARSQAPPRRRPIGRPPIMRRRSWSLRLPAAPTLSPLLLGSTPERWCRSLRMSFSPPETAQHPEFGRHRLGCGEPCTTGRAIGRGLLLSDTSELLTPVHASTRRSRRISVIWTIPLLATRSAGDWPGTRFQSGVPRSRSLSSAAKDCRPASRNSSSRTSCLVQCKA